jgi:hypothetical protein
MARNESRRPSLEAEPTFFLANQDLISRIPRCVSVIGVTKDL